MGSTMSYGARLIPTARITAATLVSKGIANKFATPSSSNEPAVVRFFLDRVTRVLPRYRAMRPSEVILISERRRFV